MSSGDRAAGAGPARSETAIFLLLLNDPEQPVAGYGLGWTVAAWDGSAPRWSQSLTGRGAGAHTTPRVAKAVAVRVLAEHGVAVDGWYDGDARGLTMFRARVSGPSPAAARGQRARGAVAEPTDHPPPIPAVRRPKDSSRQRS